MLRVYFLSNERLLQSVTGIASMTWHMHSGTRSDKAVPSSVHEWADFVHLMGAIRLVSDRQGYTNRDSTGNSVPVWI